MTRTNGAAPTREREPKQLCTFMVASMLLGIDVTRIQEVIRGQPMTPVPLAPPMIEGLINLRGQIVSAIDLRQLLQLPSRPEGATPLNVVVRHDEGAVSLLVDEIGDVLEVDEQSFERPPDTMSAASKALIEGVYKLEQGLLLLLNTELAVRVDWRASAEGRVYGK